MTFLLLIFWILHPFASSVVGIPTGGTFIPSDISVGIHKTRGCSYNCDSGFSVNRKKTMFFENRNTRCYFWRKTEKPGGNEEKSVFYWNRTILIRVWCNWITFWHLHTKNWREFVWNLITSSKHLTSNILREYWVACCVFFTVVTIFERIF